MIHPGYNLAIIVKLKMFAIFGYVFAFLSVTNTSGVELYVEPEEYMRASAPFGHSTRALRFVRFLDWRGRRVFPDKDNEVLEWLFPEASAVRGAAVILWPGETWSNWVFWGDLSVRLERGEKACEQPWAQMLHDDPMCDPEHPPSPILPKGHFYAVAEITVRCLDRQIKDDFARSYFKPIVNRTGRNEGGPDRLDQLHSVFSRWLIEYTSHHHLVGSVLSEPTCFGFDTSVGTLQQVNCPTPKAGAPLQYEPYFHKLPLDRCVQIEE